MATYASAEFDAFISINDFKMTVLLIFSLQTASPSFIPMKTTELLNKISGRGLNVLYRFTRSPHLFSPAMVSVELTFTNLGSEELMDIRVGQKVSLLLLYIISVFSIYTSGISI